MSNHICRQRPILKNTIIIIIFIVTLVLSGGIIKNIIDQEKLEVILKKMTLAEKIGQMFIFDFRTYNGKGLTDINDDVAIKIRRLTPGGIILFGENTVEALQTKNLVEDFQRSSPKIPLFIGVDQEGGAVARLKYATIMPGNMALGATGDRRLSYKVAKAVGDELKALGINMNFAPVIDINNNPANPVIGIRSFGDNPEIVTKMGLPFVKGLNDAGIVSVVKHFPGHGDTGVDSHIDLPLVPHDMERLEKVELYPYHAMIRNNIDMIMSAHITFPAIDDREGIPATISAKCLTTLLRKKMSFKGVIITDAMNMNAITESFGDAQAAEMAIMAGADIILMPQQKADTLGYIISRVRAGAIPMGRIDASVKRILTLKLKRGILEPGKPVNDQKISEIVACKTNKELKKETAAKAVTLVKNTDNFLPYKLENGQRIVFFAPSKSGTKLINEKLNALTKQLSVKNLSIIDYNYWNMAIPTAKQQQAVTKSDYVILFTRTVNSVDFSPKTSYIASFASKLVTFANSTDKKLVAVAIRNPYDIQFMPKVKSYIAAYTDWEGGGVEAALRLILGQIKPQGKLPVAILNSNEEILYPNGFGIK